MDPPEEVAQSFKAQDNKKKGKGFDGWQQENRDEQTMVFGGQNNDDLENDLFT